MAKDFAKSYEQLCWEHAVKSHSGWSNLLKQLTIPALIESVKKQLEQLETKYPQLKRE